MVKHVIIWKLKDEFSAGEKAEIAKRIKAGLEGLKGVIEGLEEITVYADLLGSSTGDLMLDSLFTDEAALKAYAVHPMHVEVADRDVRPYTAVRSCADFIV